LSFDIMKGESGLLLKMNPPLRSEEARRELLQLLLQGRIDWIETDHAPHTLKEKRGANGSYPSGIPGFPIYPHLFRWLKGKGLQEEQIQALTHDNIARCFQIKLPNRKRPGNFALAGKYDFNPYGKIMEKLGG
jgi:dihydroorotase